jgi:hypothetical protein
MIRKTLFLAALTFAGSAAADATRATSLSWISGCWGYERGGSTYMEHWLPATGNVVLGVSQRVQDGFNKEFEFLRIITSGDGFDYARQANGAEELRYGMTKQQAKSVSFESLASSDFPSKISYELTAPDALTETLEGTSKGKPATIVFPMRRIACGGN